MSRDTFLRTRVVSDELRAPNAAACGFCVGGSDFPTITLFLVR